MKTGLFAVIVMGMLAIGLRTFAADAPSPPAGQVTVTVNDKAGKPIEKAQVYFISAGGTHNEGMTDENGKVVIKTPDDKPVTVFIAHPKYLGAMQENIKPKDGMVAKLSSPSEKPNKDPNAEKPNIGSVIITSVGRTPGLDGSLDLIYDSSHRLYLFGHNLSIAGGQVQPVGFACGKAFSVEDKNGIKFMVTVNGFVGNSSTFLITYEEVPKAKSATPQK